MMKFKQGFILLVVILSLAEIRAEGECPKNQVYLNCGSACPPRCDDGPSKFCTLQCVPRCQCKQGYKLNANDECVTPEEC